MCYSVSVIRELGPDRMKPPTASGSGGAATVSRSGMAWVWVKHKLQEINPQFCSNTHAAEDVTEVQTLGVSAQSSAEVLH